MANLKGVVLAGGHGTRLRPLTYSVAKQLIPVANKPILFYGLEDMARAGIQEVGIVVSPESAQAVQAAVGDGAEFDLRVSYIEQDRPLGLAHALRVSLDFLAGASCLMYLGDNLLRNGVSSLVEEFSDSTAACHILLAQVPNPREFGVAEVDERGQVQRLVEKPTHPRSNLALVGVYLFRPSVSDILHQLKPSPRGEYEITDAIQGLMDSGHEVRARVVDGWWKDTGKKEDLIHANELVLSDLQTEIWGEMESCVSRGPVRIGHGSKLIDCRLEGPVVIGDNVRMERSVIGPNTTVGDGCQLVDCEVESSIVMEGGVIEGWKLRASITGRQVQLREGIRSGFVELTVGDQSTLVGPSLGAGCPPA